MDSRFIWVVLFILCAAAGLSSAAPATIDSPDGSVRVAFDLEEGRPKYRIERFGRELIQRSAMGFVLKGGRPLQGPFEIGSVHTRTFDETWVQPWGEKREIRNRYNELAVSLVEKGKNGRRMDVVFRVYEDGVGFRYEIPAQNGLERFEITDETTEFALAGDPAAWWIPAYNRDQVEYEQLYRRTPVSAMDTAHTPLTLETANGLYLSIHEAALTDYAAMQLAPAGRNTLKADLTPWSDGIRVKARTPMKTPWRTIQIADDPGGLITSYLILNLNEPNALGDVSWIKPGKYAGIWWAMHLDLATWSTGPRHGATTENAKKYIDFASRNGLAGVLVEGWNRGWDGDWTVHGDRFDFTRSARDYDIREVAAYASEKGVGLIGHNETGGAVPNYERQLKEAFALYEKLGIHTVKTGYVANGPRLQRIDGKGEKAGEWHHGQYMVRHHQKVVEEAARRRIMIDVHEPVKDTGLRRTWPNLMTREGARGQEYEAWSPDGGNPPEHATILPFTRLLAGPMDYTPGIVGLRFGPERPRNRVNTTTAKQLALYVVLYSPLHMAADLPENYEKYPDALRFIRDVPVDWEDTKVLHARIGDYVTIARKDRNSGDWYLGSVTDEEGRILEAPLAFLEPGVKYTAQIYRDGKDAHWEKNPYPLTVTEEPADASGVIKMRLAPGGGQAIRFVRTRP
ncbi:glycoside hydrolase family 97 protein [bacterium]|nr:glycoside hydrolase family 97 protein [bacterium]